MSWRIHSIDDDLDARLLAAECLEAAGHWVETSAGGVEAIPRLLAAPPDVVLLDVMMPGMDGMQVLARIREEPSLRDVRVIMLTGKAYAHDRQRAKQLGASGYITKPFHPERLPSEVERIAEGTAELTYWGVRGTLPVPGRSSLRYGGNTSCVTLTLPGGRLLIFDGGSGIKSLSNHLMAGGKAVDAKIFISHPHWDHINALPFFVPFYRPGNRLEILGPPAGPQSIQELFDAQMNGLHFPVTRQEFAATVTFQDLNQGEYDLDGVKVRTLLLNHPGACLGYRVDLEDSGRAWCYITDNELFPEGVPGNSPAFRENLAEFVRGADLVTIDATYSDDEYPAKRGWGHSCVTEVVDFAASVPIPNLHLFHHDPDQSDADIDAKQGAAEARLQSLGARLFCETPAEGSTYSLDALGVRGPHPMSARAVD